MLRLKEPCRAKPMQKTDKYHMKKEVKMQSRKQSAWPNISLYDDRTFMIPSCFLCIILYIA